MSSDEKRLAVGKFVEDLSEARKAFAICDEIARGMASQFNSISKRISESRPRATGREVVFGDDRNTIPKTTHELLSTVPSSEQVIKVLSDLSQAERILSELEAKKSLMGL